MHQLFRICLERYIEITPEIEKIISDNVLFRSAARNEILVGHGTVAKYMYFVLQGCLRVFVVDDAGNESTRYLAFEGDFGTSFPSYVLKEPSMAVVECLEPSKLIMISLEAREELIKTIPGWETLQRKQTEIAYIQSIRRIESLITSNAAERYKRLIAEQPDITKRLSSRIVADYLGISAETLSRLKSKID